jgi:hypothetical protein
MPLFDVSPLVMEEVSAALANRAGVLMQECTESGFMADAVSAFLLLQEKTRMENAMMEKLFLVRSIV